MAFVDKYDYYISYEATTGDHVAAEIRRALASKVSVFKEPVLQRKERRAKVDKSTLDPGYLRQKTS